MLANQNRSALQYVCSSGRAKGQFRLSRCVQSCMLKQSHGSPRSFTSSRHLIGPRPPNSNRILVSIIRVQSSSVPVPEKLYQHDVCTGAACQSAQNMLNTQMLALAPTHQIACSPVLGEMSTSLTVEW
jgi:hypothetical protein